MGKLTDDSLLESVEMSAVNGPEACEGDRTVLLSAAQHLAAKSGAAGRSTTLPHPRGVRTHAALAFHAERAQRTQHGGVSHVTGIPDAFVALTAAFARQLALRAPFSNQLGEVLDPLLVGCRAGAPGRHGCQRVSQCVPEEQVIEPAVGGSCNKRLAVGRL